MSSVCKHWCFTLNNYTDEDIKRLQSIQELDVFQYIVFGKERGDSGTPHLQGFVSFKRRKTFRFTQDALGGKAHLERARGTPSQAAAYCKKDGAFEEYGICPGGQGTRTDLLGVATAVKAGTPFKEISEKYPAEVLRYGSGILRLRQYYRPNRTQPPQIWVFWGKTGTGKTRRVWEFADQEKLYVHPGERWFDGYDQHPAVLFDDFDGSWFKLTYLLKLLDRYLMPVPVKGAYSWWCPNTIYITSNQHPKDWYPNGSSEHKEALMRRLNEFGTIEEVK